MKSTKIFAKITAALTTFTLTATAAFAAPMNQIVNEIATATSEDYISIDAPVGDTDTTRRQFVPYIYETRPDIFLSAADFYNVYYSHKSDDVTITSIHLTDDLISAWNDETYADSF